MTRRKSVSLKWTLVLMVVIFCPYVYARPQDVSTSSVPEITTENSIRESNRSKILEDVKTLGETKQSAPSKVTPESSRDVKTKVPIRESIKLVANQLLDKPNITGENTVIIDTRVPPKLRNQAKHKIKTRNEDGEEPLENAHVGEAVPVTMEELETENHVQENESTTSNEGISTWVLVSSPVNKENTAVLQSTEPTKTDNVKKQKPLAAKNKNKKPQKDKVSSRRPVVSTTTKSDLVAEDSVVNENGNNKVRDTVPSNVQKNKNAVQRPTKETSTSAPLSEVTAKTEVTKAPTKTSASTTKGTNKTKKKNKNKQKASTTTEDPFIGDSALLPMEAKEQEIELEVSTPPVTTKKPKRSSTKKKNKTKKRKTKPKPEDETSITEIKTSNKTKSAKPSKKPQAVQGAITSQLYNYFSREVMPSVGVGVLGLASIVGIASYFLYPFSTPVRRTFEVDKRDDLYKNNAEDYANDGNGQAEEEMLGTVLAGMPTHAKNKLNPYAAQTAYINRYPVKKEQDLRYRHVTAKYEPAYNARYPQQKTGIAHGAVYSKPVSSNYQPHYETRHAYTTEGKFNFDKLPTSYSPYPAVEPIYAAPQTGPSSGISSYGNDASNSVVYGVKPSAESDFKPVYPFDSQFYSETTNSPATYAPTSLYLGSNNDAQQSEEKYEETSNEDQVDDGENKFVVGNVPKELAESATPAVVPEHGPRKLNRKKRNTLGKRSISSSLEEILRTEKENKDIFISNEIDDSFAVPLRKLAPITENVPINVDSPTSLQPEVFPVYVSSVDLTKTADETTTVKNEIIESISTVPIQDERKASTTEADTPTEVEATTKTFKVYEVFSPETTASPTASDVTTAKPETTTQFRNMMTETTTELRSETTSTMPTLSPFTDSKDQPSTTLRPTPIVPDVVTYPQPTDSSGFYTFFRKLVQFKMNLGMSIVQNLAESMEKFLKSINTETTTQRFAKASKKV